MRKGYGSSKKIGLPPGSLVYTGDKLDEDITIEYIAYSNDYYERKIFSETRDFSFFKDTEHLKWINIDGIHSPALIERIGNMYGLDSLIMEDLLNPSQRPKFEERDNFLFLVIKMLFLNPENNDIQSEQVSFILGKDYLLTFQEIPGDIFHIIRKRLELGTGKIRKKSIGYLAYSLLDAIMDNYFLVLESIEGEVDQLERNLMDKPNKEHIIKIMELQQKVTLLKKAIFPTIELTLKLTNEEGEEFFHQDTKLYLKDLHDHSVIIYENMENLSSRFGNLSQLYHAALGSDTNEIMKVLTVMSATFIPLTFLAGLYGMNFQYIPELDWRWGYFALLGVMLTIFVAMLIFFKRKRWW